MAALASCMDPEELDEVIDKDMGVHDLDRELRSEDHMDIYVDPDTGSNSNDGSRDSPVASLQAALDKLPIIIMHQTTIHLEDGVYDKERELAENGSVSSGVHVVNYLKGLDGMDEPFKITGNTSDPSRVRFPDIYRFNLSIRGGVPYRTVFEGFKANAKIQNYNGAMAVRDCVLNGNSALPTNAGIDGYAGFTYAERVTFNSEIAAYANQGHQIVLNNCRGSVTERYVENDGGVVTYNSNNNIEEG